MQGNTNSYKVATTLAAQRIVYVSDVNTVAYLNTIASLPIGVTIDTVEDTTQAIPVQENGIARIYANDTFSAGDLVSGDASGRAIPYTAAPGTATCFVGVALEACAATGTVVQVNINPNMQ